MNNPRYLAYCKATGDLTPEETLARDKERWPGGCMTGFMFWVQGKWAEWRKLNGRSRDSVVTEDDQQSFD